MGATTIIPIINTRGLKAKLYKVDQLASGAAILGIYETWLRNQYKDVTQALDDSTVALPIPNSSRGQGGEGIVINPLLTYRTVAKHSNQTIQSMTISANNTTWTVIYRSRKAKWSDEPTVLQDINRMSGQRAVSTGDKNAA